MQAPPPAPLPAPLPAAGPLPVGTVRPVDLVLQGGGMKGVALAGALSVLDEQGFEPRAIAGSSAGAVIAALVAAGYRGAELYDLAVNQRFGRLLDKGWEDYLMPESVPLLSLFLDQGIYEGKAFHSEISRLLAARGVHTFRDLVDPDCAGDPRFRYRLQVVASDLTEHRLLILPRDAEHLGMRPDDFEVALAVRMSMCVPIIFEPVRFLNPRTGREHLIVDGGLLCNYPLWLFDASDRPWPSFGLHIVSATPAQAYSYDVLQSPNWLGRFARVAQRIPSLRYLIDLLLTLLEAHDRMTIETADAARTIHIHTDPVGLLDFELTRERSEALYQAGRSAATAFLAARSAPPPV